MLQKNCESCGNTFHYSSSRRPNARFCSKKCLSKLTKHEQDAKRKYLWESETRDQYIEAMKIKFEKFVIRSSGCWDWAAYKNKQGYGIMLHRNKTLKAHRASYMIYKGDIPDGIFVLHACDNPSCANPEHLFLGNNLINMRDMAAKKRNKPRSKLLEHQIKTIKQLLKLGVSCAKIGRDYNVSDVCIWSIKNNKSWKDIN